jgi:hypothetical protein
MHFELTTNSTNKTATVEIWFESIQTYTASIPINWVKLEVGNKRTYYMPPNKTIELLKCKRYYLNVPSQYFPVTYASNELDWFIALPIDFARVPTLIASSYNFYMTGDSGSAISIPFDKVSVRYTLKSASILMRLPNSIPTGITVGRTYASSNLPSFDADYPVA